MSLNHIPAAAVLAAEKLDRADDLDELEAIWRSAGCDSLRGAAGQYVRRAYEAVCHRLNSRTRALDLARAM